jgi:hypothetical protein
MDLQEQSGLAGRSREEIEFEGNVLEVADVDLPRSRDIQVVRRHFDSVGNETAQGMTPFCKFHSNSIAARSGAQNRYGFDSWCSVVATPVCLQNPPSPGGIVAEIDGLESWIRDIEVEIGLLAEYQANLKTPRLRRHPGEDLLRGLQRRRCASRHRHER